MADSTYLTLDKKGRATLPEEVREALGVGPGDFVRLEPTARGTYELVPAMLVPREDLWQLHPEMRARLAEARAEIEADQLAPFGLSLAVAPKPPTGRAPEGARRKVPTKRSGRKGA